MPREKVLKKRGSNAYEKKVRRTTAWYNHLLKEREKEVVNPNTKEVVKRKPLQNLDYYIGKIKKVVGNG